MEKPPMNNQKKVKHIAIIMDGNGRWAKQRGLPRSFGHRAGIKALERTIKACAELEISVLTVFAFSTENWDRPKKEISALMGYLERNLKTQSRRLKREGIRFMVSGDITRLPRRLQAQIKKVAAETRDNKRLVFNLALNYGGRQEIINSVKRILNDCRIKRLNEKDINEDLFRRYLYTAELPDPDLLIRTSGEMRLSNFLLWQLCYTELYFVDKFWPDFGKKDLKQALLVYDRRQRRFGRIGK
jgi:undecaprenyl diphosphate synthase